MRPGPTVADEQDEPDTVGRLAVIGLHRGVAEAVAAYRSGMTRTVLTVLGILLAIWLVITVIGALIATLKFFLYVGFVVFVIMAVVAVIGRFAKSDS
jgi:hypothetical protein